MKKQLKLIENSNIFPSTDELNINIVMNSTLPCPFCGKQPNFGYYRNEYREDIFYLKCNKCNAKFFECKFEILHQPPYIEIVKKLVNKWNKRYSL
jgi:formate dehydrogenase maturation protein FdhE